MTKRKEWEKNKEGDNGKRVKKRNEWGRVNES